jgi:bifunctional non-homologous end joining protein LigD
MPDRPAPDLEQLLTYQKKRDFSQTPEPATGAPDPNAPDLTFVVQQHRARRMHWDFRLEVDGVLASWAVPKGPSLNPKDKRMAAHTEDHPYDYGSFEGIIPEGNYGAGEVIVWDRGTYSPDEKGAYSWGNREEANERIRKEIEAGKLSFFLRGEKLHGSWTLVRTARDPKAWLLIKHRDEYASERDVLEDDRSVMSGLTVRDLQEGRMPRLDGDGAGRRKPHELAREAPFPKPRDLQPMLLTLVDKPFSRDGWLFEPKMDGVRIVAFVNEGKIDLRTRRGNASSAQYPEVVRGLEKQRVKSAVFDGEVVAIGDRGVPDFQELQARINLSNPKEVERAAETVPAYYHVFDLLHLDGYDLREVPLIDRKSLLWRTLEQGRHVKYVDHVREDGEELYEAALRLGYEGIAAKREESTYEAGVRSRSWMKVKHVNEQDFVVGGFTEGEGSRKKTFGGLLVGYYDDGDLRFAASVGSGLTDRMLNTVMERLRPLCVDEAPFVSPPTVVGGRWAGSKSAQCLWVKPEMVVRVAYNSWTRDGNLRAPVFKGLRDDVDPRSIRREQAEAPRVDVIEDAAPRPSAGSRLERAVASVLDQLEAERRSDFTLDIDGAKLKLTNLDKVMWPATADHAERTKRELIRYYARVAPYIMPHLKDRPLTLTRYPNGIDGKSFYQKHWPSTFPKGINVERVLLYSSQYDEDQEYIVANNLETLIWLAQLADIEMHAWMARTDPEPDALDLPKSFTGSEENFEASVLNYPDYMILDLDPYIYAGTEKKGEEPELNRRAFEKTREVAFGLKELLQQLRLSSFIKTTGKTGLHVYVPIVRQYNYDEVRAATEVIGRYLMQQRPDEITMEWATEKRRGKIFFDHNQNTRGKTLAAQYSLRPSPGATVSAPVTWEELPDVYPTQFDIDTVPERLSRIGDIWKDIVSSKQDLRALLGAGR